VKQWTAPNYAGTAKKAPGGCRDKLGEAPRKRRLPCLKLELQKSGYSGQSSRRLPKISRFLALNAFRFENEEGISAPVLSRRARICRHILRQWISGNSTVLRLFGLQP